MAGGFAITTTTTNAKLPSNRQGQFQFTVTNASGRPLTVRGKAVAQTPEQSAWFTIEGQAERTCAPNATLNFTVNVAIPLTAPATPIAFHLDAIGIENPDEYNVQGPPIVLEVAPATQPKAPFPWWIVAVAVAAVILLGGGTALAYKLISGSGKTVASSSPTPDKVSRFVGTWSTSAQLYPQFRLVITRSGTGVTGTFGSSAGYTDTTCTSPAPNGFCIYPATETFDSGQDNLTITWTMFGRPWSAVATNPTTKNLGFVLEGRTFSMTKES